MDPTYKNNSRPTSSIPKKEFSTVNSMSCEYICSNNSCIKYNGIWHTVTMIMKEEGIRGFAKGVLPRIISTAPSSAVSWSVYEIIKRSLIK